MINGIKQLLDWIYQKKCYFCGKNSSEIICAICFEKIEINHPQAFRIIQGTKIYSASFYEKEFQKLIRGLKYHRQKDLAKPFAKILYLFWQKLECQDENIEIVPVPLFYKREKQRGYNQMLLVANEFSRLTGYNVNNRIAKRVKDTKPQYKLSRIERIENMKDAFSIDISKYSGKRLLIIDDLCTTGATIGELAKVLKEKGISDFIGLTGSSS